MAEECLGWLRGELPRTVHSTWLEVGGTGGNLLGMGRAGPVAPTASTANTASSCLAE